MKNAGLLNSIVRHGALTPTDSNAYRSTSMSIYKSHRINYRKIYEQHYGSIPKDPNGRTYDIHHIDGNRENNHPSNLVALSIQEHYNIHMDQEDYGAAQLLAIKMEKSPELISELAKKGNVKRVSEGTHHFLDSEIQRKNAKIQNAKRVADGTHHFLDREKSSAAAHKRVANGTNPFCDKDKARERANKKVADGTHPFLGGDIQRKRVREGTHHFLNHPKIECPHCGKIGNIGPMKRWHGDKCKVVR